MIKNTFQHIPGFSATKEFELWRQKVFTWDDFENRFNTQLTLNFTEAFSLFNESKAKFQAKDIEFFTRNLSPHAYYRIAHTFPEKTIFLDIETTGLSRYYDRITIVGWSILDRYEVFVDGDEDAKSQLIKDLAYCDCIVTFNGSLFDIPFIKQLLPGVKIPLCHIDLRFFSRRAGLAGGQKLIEDFLGFQRPNDLHEVDGFEATILWHKYKEGDNDALKKLIRYNACDIDGMKLILESVTKMILRKEGSFINEENVFPFSHYKSDVQFATAGTFSTGITIESYKGKVGPVIFLSDLPNLTGQKVVGIDLTGSENKASGWALLENGIATTKTILSDRELIEETIKCNPAIISIDSPLSIPVGRTSVFDDDPYRDQFGITRECERIMAKRGVKSYPCLIQSMQKLTRRGIFLAGEFRKLGYPVIESYPGAAQDILGIPRKGKSLEFLVKGLQAFGIRGSYNPNEVTHDEIDAITSALVGYFFLAGKYEGLGNEVEDYLIIPSLEVTSNKNQIVIGISGLLSAGKTTMGKMLEEYGFSYGRYSMVVDSWLTKENKEINRSNQQELGDFFNKEKGQRWLGAELLKLLPKTKNIVIDGLRFPEDSSFLREKFGNSFYHIHLVCDEEIRKKRYVLKKSNDKPFEIANKHRVEAKIKDLKKLADHVIVNNYTVESLREQVLGVCKMLNKKLSI